METLPACAAPRALARASIIDAPFATGVRRIDVPAGSSILDVIELAGFSPRAARRCVVQIRGDAIAREHWERVRPKPGAEIVIGMRPADGEGSNPLRTILQLAVTVVATVLVATGNPIAAAAVQVFGNLAVNALVPPPRARVRDNGAVAPSYAIEEAGNDIALFGPVPCVFGRRRIVLKQAARAYTEIAGDDVYIRMLLTPGIGPGSFEDTRIGATPIGNYAGVEMELRGGWVDEPPTTLFSNTVIENAPNVTLAESAGWIVRQTESVCDEISVDWAFQNGLFGYDHKADQYVAAGVTIAIRYRPAGAGEDEWITRIPTYAAADAAAASVGKGRTANDWTNSEINAWANALDWSQAVNGLEVYAQSAERKPHRRNMAWPVPRAKYDVAIRRVTPDTTSDKISDVATWTALRAIRAEPPDVPDYTPLMALRIKASDQLQGRIEPISTVFTSMRGAWNGTDFNTWDFTRNPADHFIAVLKGPGQERPEPDSRIDFASLGAWAEICRLRGWKSDLVIEDGRSTEDLLVAIAACGRARPVRRNGKLGVVCDVPRAPSGQMFTPRNMRNFKVRRDFLPPVHAVRVPFANEEADYRQDERIVYAPGYSAANATVYETLAPFEGIVEPARIHNEVNFHLAVALNRGETYTFDVDLEHAVSARGDVTYLATDVLLEGLAQGRVKALLDAAGEPLGEGATHIAKVQLDEPMPMASGSYVLRVRRPDANVVWPVVTAAGLSTVLEFAAPVPVSTGPRRGDLCAFGLAGEETMQIVIRDKGKPDSDGVVAITAEAYGHPNIDEAGSGVAPPFNSTIRRAWARAPAKPIINQAGLSWRAEGVVVPFSLEAGADSIVATIEARWRRGRDGATLYSWARLPDLQPSERLLVTPAPGIAFSVEVELTAVDVFGRRSPPATATIETTAWTLPDVSNLDVYRDGIEAVLVWGLVVAPVPIEYETRWGGDTWETSQPLQRVTGTTTRAPLALNSVADVRFFVKARTIEGGLYSVNARGALLAAAELTGRNVMLTTDSGALGWPGVRHYLTPVGSGDNARLDVEYAEGVLTADDGTLLTDDEGTVLTAPIFGLRAAQADYFATIDVGIGPFISKVWSHVSASRVATPLVTVDDLENLTVDDLASLSLEEEVVPTDAALLSVFISTDIKPADVYEGFRLLGHARGSEGTAAVIEYGETYGAPVWLTNGVAIADGAIVWTRGVPATFALIVDCRVTLTPESDGGVHRLGADDGRFLELRYNFADELLELIDQDDAIVAVEAPGWSVREPFRIQIAQTATAREIRWISRTDSAGFAASAALAPSGAFTEIRLGQTGTTVDELASLTVDDLAALTVDDLAPSSLRMAYADLELRESPLSAAALALRGPAAFTPFVPLIPADYNFQAACVHVRLETLGGIGERISIDKTVIYVDVPDLVDRGEISVPADGLRVTYGRNFYTPPQFIPRWLRGFYSDVTVETSNPTREGIDVRVINKVNGRAVPADLEFVAAGFGR